MRYIQAKLFDNLTELAQKKLLRPVIGREQEIQRIIDVLCRAERSHPILMGDIGVGCSVIVEGLAQYLLQEKKPARLENTIIWRINFHILMVESKDLAENINQLIKQIDFNRNHIVLVFEGLELLDNAAFDITQRIIAGIKRLLIKNNCNLILLCNEHFYIKFIIQDSYMCRYCVPLSIAPVTFSQAVKIILSHCDDVKKYYHVDIVMEDIPSIVRLAQVHIRQSVLPDSAIDLLDAVAARVVARQLECQISLKHVIDYISEHAGIEKNILQKTFEEKITSCVDHLSQKIIGQQKALEIIEQCLQVGYVKLNSHVPLTSMLFVGLNGIGKRSVAFELSNYLYGSDSHFQYFDMSKFSQPSSVEQLIGPYQTTETMGQLTSALKEHPFSVCLLDKIELAHSDVIQALQAFIFESHSNHNLFEHSVIIMTTEVGSEIIFGQDKMMEKKDAESSLLQLIANDIPGVLEEQSLDDFDYEILMRKIEPILAKQFGGRFLQHYVLVPFVSWTQKGLMQFVKKEFSVLQEHLQLEQNIHLLFDKHFYHDFIALLSVEQRNAQGVKQFIEQKLFPEISQTILESRSRGEEVGQLRLLIDEYGDLVCHAAKETSFLIS